MRDSIRGSLARGSLIAVTLVVTGVFSGTALSSSATRSSEGETVISAVEQQRFVATKLELTTVPQIKRYLRSLGVNPTGVVVQRGPMNYAGPNCPGLAWNCTTATRVIQLSASGAAAAANRFICRRDSGAGTANPADTPSEQSCVIVQPGGASNSATCDMDTTGAAGLISQTCLITQGGASNTAVAKLAATLTGPGTEQDVRQRIEVKQTGGAVKNMLRATENARLRLNFGSGGALSAKQDFNQVVCANQQAAGSGSNTATVTQKGDSLAQARNRGDVTVLQNTEGRASTCLPTGPAAPFADFSGTGHDPTLCPVLGEISDDPKENANICARVQQDSVNGRNRITQDQHALVNGVIDRVGKVDLNQGSAEGGVDSTQDQRSTNLSTIADTQRSEQLSSVAQASGPVNMTQVEDPRCCAAGHQLGNTGNTWKLRQTLRQRAFVNKVLVNPETFEGGEIEQTGSNQGNCTTSGTPPAGCTVEQDLTNNVESETNSCGPASSCDVIIECSAASSSSSCTTEEDEDVTLSNTATVSSTTPDPNLENNSDTETTVVSGSAPDALLFSLGLRSLSPRGVTPAAQDPTPSVSIQAAVPPDVIIDNGSLVQLGLHLEGHLNVCCGSASSEIGETAVGLRYLPTDGEGTAPGCDCEGWGIANADDATGTFTGHANADDGIVNLTVDPTSGPYGPDESVDPDSTGTRFRAITTTSDRIKVTQDYHPSSTPNLYEVVVTMENIGATPIGDVRYRRVMDWDIPPTTFWEWSEIHVGTSTALVRATSDGFLTADPLNMTPPSAGVPPTTLESGDPDYFQGPGDQGSSFDFTFGSLQPGQTRSFRIFYGAAGTQALAKAAIAAVGGEIYSLGMPSTSFDEGAPAATEGPNVFIFAFAGVGGEPVGDISLAPLTAENQIGEDHTVTATLDDDGAPISGKVVTFTVVSGPNAGVTGTDTSDANGEATFTYTSSLTGTDQIEAKFVDDNENIQTSNRVEKTWVAVPASADLSVDKSDSPDPVEEGEELVYTITVSNSGPDAAQAVTLTDVLPESVTFNSAEASQGSCTGTSTVTCNLGTIANGASATVTITVTP